MGGMIAALKATLLELLGSKKFLLLLATVIAAGAAKLGWNVSTDALMPYLGLVATAILAQGIADHGKGAAEVNAKADSPPKQAGFVNLRLMALLAAVGMFIACGASQRAAEKQLGTCTEDALVKKLEPVVESIATSGVSDVKGVLGALAVAFGAEEIDCVASFVKQLLLQKVGGVSSDAVKRLDEWLNRSKSAESAPSLDQQLAQVIADKSLPAVVDKCTDNLCGMDSYCSCHGSGDTKRCWSQQDDCQTDAACCDGHAKDCKAQGTDRCTQRTHDERVKRDSKKAKP